MHSTHTRSNPEEPAPGLPSVFTIYFSGLDHVEHLSWEGMSGNEDARLCLSRASRRSPC